MENKIKELQEKLRATDDKAEKKKIAGHIQYLLNHRYEEAKPEAEAAEFEKVKKENREFGELMLKWMNECQPLKNWITPRGIE